jgi:hypothetical protein
MRNLDAFAAGDLPDGLACARGDLAAVKAEADDRRALAFAFDLVDRRGMRDTRLAAALVVAARRALVVVAVADRFLIFAVGRHRLTNSRAACSGPRGNI